MKRLLTAVVLLLTLQFSSCFAEALPSADRLMQQSSISSEVLQGHNLLGVCMRSDATFVYTSSSYAMLDATTRQEAVAASAIRHPRIRTNAPSVQQVLYEEGTYYLLVFDHAANKSYIITYAAGQADYGKMYAKELHTFARTDDGFFLAGFDTKRRLWYAAVSDTGKVRWERTAAYQDESPVYCTAADENVLVISASYASPAFFLSLYNQHGDAVSRTEVRPSDAPDGFSYQVFQASCDGTAIVLCGTRQSKSENIGFFLRLSPDGSVLTYQEYSSFMRIQSFVCAHDQYTLLALTGAGSSSPYAAYLIAASTGLTSPLEEKGSIVRPIGLAKDENDTVYVFGMLDASVTAPDGFLAAVERE